MTHLPLGTVAGTALPSVMFSVSGCPCCTSECGGSLPVISGCTKGSKSPSVWMAFRATSSLLSSNLASTVGKASAAMVHSSFPGSSLRKMSGFLTHGFMNLNLGACRTCEISDKTSQRCCCCVSGCSRRTKIGAMMPINMCSVSDGHVDKRWRHVLFSMNATIISIW